MLRVPQAQTWQPVLKAEPAPEPKKSGNGNGKAAAPAVAEPAAVQPTAGTAYDTQTLTKALLNVVSEKTGYPVEMLELDSDMEADLGIDSIKRVEILGAMRAQFPLLPPADPEAFAEVRTLGQTVDYMASRGPASWTLPLPPLSPCKLRRSRQPAPRRRRRVRR